MSAADRTKAMQSLERQGEILKEIELQLALEKSDMTVSRGDTLAALWTELDALQAGDLSSLNNRQEHGLQYGHESSGFMSDPFGYDEAITESGSELEKDENPQEAITEGVESTKSGTEPAERSFRRIKRTPSVHKHFKETTKALREIRKRSKTQSVELSPPTSPSRFLAQLAESHRSEGLDNVESPNVRTQRTLRPLRPKGSGAMNAMMEEQGSTGQSQMMQKENIAPASPAVEQSVERSGDKRSLPRSPNDPDMTERNKRARVNRLSMSPTPADIKGSVHAEWNTQNGK